MKVPGIEQLLESAEKDLAKKKIDLKNLQEESESNESLIPLVALKRSECAREEEMLAACKAKVRHEKIEKLGL